MRKNTFVVTPLTQYKF